MKEINVKNADDLCALLHDHNICICSCSTCLFNEDNSENMIFNITIITEYINVGKTTFIGNDGYVYHWFYDFDTAEDCRMCDHTKIYKLLKQLGQEESKSIISEKPFKVKKEDIVLMTLYNEMNQEVEIENDD